MKNRKGRGFVIWGVLLLASALALTVYNVETQKAAGIASQEILKELTAEMPKADAIPQAVLMESAFPEKAISVEYIPDYILNPNMDMPEMAAEGGNYIATLSIPSLGLELPVNTEWNYANLKTAPCRYCGSTYTGDLVICAHNYNIHFGSIKHLNVGDSVILTDMDGNKFRYEVIGAETLDPYAIEEMKTGDWDLTLFTCTVGGASRIAVRCEKV